MFTTSLPPSLTLASSLLPPPPSSPCRLRSSTTSKRAAPPPPPLYGLVFAALLPDPSAVSTASMFASILPANPWSPSIASESIAPQLFAASLFPYLGFLYHLTKSNSAPKLTLFGFYFLLVFVGATIPAGIYAKVHYGTSLSNVDWLHGGAESFLTVTNFLIVLGLRNALRDTSPAGDSSKEASLQTAEEENLPLTK